MGTSGRRRRKPKHKLPPLPPYEPYPRGGFWRLGGPLTSEHEAEAREAERERRPGRLGRWITKILGGGRPTS
jgi:hypothetical protein